MLRSVPDAGVAPQPFVQAERQERDDSNEQEQRQEGARLRGQIGRDDAVEPEPQRQVIGQRDEAEVQNDDDDAAVIQRELERARHEA